MFRFITAQLVVSGACRQVDIISCFGVSKNSVLRSVNKLRNGLNGKLKTRNARFGQLTNHSVPEQGGKKYERWLRMRPIGIRQALLAANQPLFTMHIIPESTTMNSSPSYRAANSLGRLAFSYKT